MPRGDRGLASAFRLNLQTSQPLFASLFIFSDPLRDAVA
jgi:hypothetical protein